MSQMSQKRSISLPPGVIHSSQKVRCLLGRRQGRAAVSATACNTRHHRCCNGRPNPNCSFLKALQSIRSATQTELVRSANSDDRILAVCASCRRVAGGIPRRSVSGVAGGHAPRGQFAIAGIVKQYRRHRRARAPRCEIAYTTCLRQERLGIEVRIFEGTALQQSILSAGFPGGCAEPQHDRHIRPRNPRERRSLLDPRSTWQSGAPWQPLRSTPRFLRNPPCCRSRMFGRAKVSALRNSDPEALLMPSSGVATPGEPTPHDG